MLMADITFFPIEIAVSAQRPGIAIYSLSLRKVLLIELTVPLKDRVAAAHTIKTTRYTSLLSACQSNGLACFTFQLKWAAGGLWPAPCLIASASLAFHLP